MKPVKYEHNSEERSHDSAKSKLFPAKNLTNGGLVSLNSFKYPIERMTSKHGSEIVALSRGCHQTSNINTLKAMKLLITQMYFHSRLDTWFQWIGQRQLQDETRHIYVLWFDASYIRCLAVYVCICQSDCPPLVQEVTCYLLDSKP